MTWDEKIELAKLLNNCQYKDAVEFVSNKEIDPQAMDIFVTGFDLTKIELLKPIGSIIIQYEPDKLDWRSGLMLETIKEALKQEGV